MKCVCTCHDRLSWLCFYMQKKKIKWMYWMHFSFSRHRFKLEFSPEPHWSAIFLHPENTKAQRGVAENTLSDADTDAVHLPRTYTEHVAQHSKGWHAQKKQKLSFKMTTRGNHEPSYFGFRSPPPQNIDKRSYWAAAKEITVDDNNGELNKKSRIQTVFAAVCFEHRHHIPQWTRLH